MRFEGVLLACLLALPELVAGNYGVWSGGGAVRGW